MTKKHFIALADHIRNGKGQEKGWGLFDNEHIASLADFCQSQNSNFKRDRWLSYVAGECGKNGGKVK